MPSNDHDGTAGAPSYPEEYLIGILLFNKGDHFESHEVWEALWKATPGPDREFLQGLIQVSVSLCHYYNGNVRGAKKLRRTATEHLRPFAPRFMGLDLDAFFAALEICYAPIADVDPMHPIGLDLQLVPRIELDPAPQNWPEIPDWVYDEHHAD